MTVPSIISRNLTASISDYLPQFLVAPNIFFNATCFRPNNYESDWSRFDQKIFLLDYFSVNWDNLLLSSNTSTEKFYKTFLEKSLLDSYTPLKKFLKINQSLKISPQQLLVYKILYL